MIYFITFLSPPGNITQRHAQRVYLAPSINYTHFIKSSLGELRTVTDPRGRKGSWAQLRPGGHNRPDLTGLSAPRSTCPAWASPQSTVCPVLLSRSNPSLISSLPGGGTEKSVFKPSDKTIIFKKTHTKLKHHGQ